MVGRVLSNQWWWWCVLVGGHYLINGCSGVFWLGGHYLINGGGGVLVGRILLTYLIN